MSFMIEARKIERIHVSGADTAKVKPDYIAQRLAKLAGWAYGWKWHKYFLVEKGTGCRVEDAKGKPVCKTGLRPSFGSMDVEKEYFDQLEGSEGRIPYMYLDSKGNVTVGLGHLIESPEAATGLRFYWGRTVVDYDYPASAEDIRWAFEAVHKRQDLASGGHTKFEPLTDIRMSQNDIGDLAVLDIWRKVQEIKRKTEFSGFDTFPPAAKLGLLDIAYNSGVAVFIIRRKKAGSRNSSKPWKCATENGRQGNRVARSCPKSATCRCGSGSRRRPRRSPISSTPPAGRKACNSGTSSGQTRRAHPTGGTPSRGRPLFPLYSGFATRHLDTPATIGAAASLPMSLPSRPPLPAPPGRRARRR